MVKAQETLNSGAATTMLLASPAYMHAFAARLAPFAHPGDVLALEGDLGSGKTTFARGFINALCASHGLPPEDVPSPTFTLVQEYELPGFTLYHVDLYRIEAEAELHELGLDDAFAQGVSLIEWPDRLGRLLPASRLEISFRQGGPGDDEDLRFADLTAFGAWKGRIPMGTLNG